MERETIVQYCQCHQAIISGESFVCFKTPRKETYRFFHYRFRVGDCWEGHLNERK